ncbi:undecaprenyl-diphosphate phosphatase [Persephonella atlantica]|uniref:Undecaprenyl-diphosphatase n=1 Tax=Persephonella atlantica TaxID=2699429 RepID=A0ABS1GIT7_9AQUI|nr:undecaprenyl-diphosphate phosphatase [Persephonella atlantica]MBK3332851.1 undecaprenyl-diphosphate phosphatase [Persephonella atlantica]
MTVWESVLLGIIEGLTEFLPVSSTGHLILASHLLGIKQTEAHKTFEVAIQLGSILAVVFLYREKLFKDVQLWKKLIVAFIPTGILGFLLYKIIKSLFSPYVVAFMLILGGIVFILIEKFYRRQTHTVRSLDDISYTKAFLIGVFQSLAMIPGTSRSGATIIGGLLLGFDRKTAAEFSFLLAVPTMFVATGYDVFKNYHHFQIENWITLGTGFFTAFVFAVIAIKFFLNFLKKHTFVPFGIYRIILGVLFFLFFL